MSQSELADALSVTFQQVQKYEKGTNRISASRLCEVATALRVPTAWLLDSAEDPALTSELLLDRESRQLVKAFQGLPLEYRRHVLGIVMKLREAPFPK